ncbi:multimeric flavodoxin WrbA [Methanolinea mesophila]|uniref:flavodoxin family protein n=1 Tax=Methanolinea mesophila TaxID=547055 RepID=UPI001AE12AC5|nr:flavodoxin family protein [Methanolinea mesophila]MBP1929077.1 multimeric flavodoxin WrbA [Methanolinea mesophila]
MTVRVVGLSGSPHRHGNTETLLDAFLDGTRNAGASVEKVILKDLDYSACRGCNACHKDGQCIVKDEAIPLFDTIMGVDCLAVASPIYSMGITAELKGLIDRAQYIWARKFILKTLYFSNEHIRLHKGIFISTAGQDWDNVFDAAFPAITAFFNTIGFEYYDNIIANQMDRWKGVKNHPTAMTEAREKGEKAVRAIERIRQEAEVKGN